MAPDDTALMDGICHLISLNRANMSSTSSPAVTLYLRPCSLVDPRMRLRKRGKPMHFA
uniref:Uncharacterized protein n=2 Tax=Arundo donax TaxID=35708 RepID=A0A0A9E7M9_ARUDO